MAADEPLREEDLPPQLREQGSETQHSERNDSDQPTVSDLVYQPDESSGKDARDAMARDSDPPGKMELHGTATPQATGANSGDGASKRDRDDAPANEPPGAADKPPIDNVVADARSQVATSPEVSAEDSAATAPAHSVSPPASVSVGESSEDGDSSVDATDKDSSADEAPADSMADTGETAAVDSPDSPPSTDSAATTGEEPSTTAAASSATAADGAPAQAAAANAENAPTASPGLAPEHVTAAARSQPHDEDLSPRTTDLLTPGSDGQPPMARPIVLVRLTDDETHRMINDALAKVSADDSALMESIAADHVDYIFWQIRAEERAILRFD